MGGVIQPDWLCDVLRDHRRIAIFGAPKTGKTTLSSTVTDRSVIHSDDWMHLSWSDASTALVQHCNAVETPYVVEGVAIPRALRKGLLVDAVIQLTKRYEALTPAQNAMSKGLQTVFREWLDRPEASKIPIYVW